MDPRHRRRPSSDRFLSTFSPPSAPTPLTFTTTTTSTASADDFSEDDVFFTSSTFSPTTTAKTAAKIHLPSTATSPKPPSLRSQKSFNLESPGILAALPEPPTSPSLPIFNHKPSPSRTISIIPQNSPSMTSHHHNNHHASSLPSKYHQSAPMHVPIMPNIGRRQQRRRQGSAFGFEDIEDDDAAAEDDDDGEMLPPHEMVARRLKETPKVSCSVLEGAGRTLKGRDLRQVRNAVFRQTDIRMSVPTSKSDSLGLLIGIKFQAPANVQVRMKDLALVGHSYFYCSATVKDSRIELSVCSEVKGTVSCTDCEPNYDLSGIKVLVKCDQVKKLSSAITNKKGVFEAALPSNAPYSQASASPNCLAKLLGGPSQLFALKQNVVSKIVTAQGGKDTYSTLTPLVFSKSCHGKCGSLSTSFGSSKTFDLPIPPEYGLPPTSLYTPFIPIIGIP